MHGNRPRRGNIRAAAPQNGPNLARVAEFSVILPGLVDLEAQGGIGLGTGRRALGITHNGAPVIISGRGKLESPADRLGPKDLSAFFPSCACKHALQGNE